MHQYLGMLSSVVLPIVVICLIGAVVGRFRKIETSSLADISLYVLSPSLVLVVLSQVHLSDENVIDILSFTVLQTLLCWGIAKLSTRLFRLSGPVEAAVTLTTIFGNSNNYGLPVLLLAYGAAGLTNGAVYVIGQIVLINSLGLYIASRAEVRPRQALFQVLKAPLIYALVIGTVLDALSVHIPPGIETGLHMLGDAYAAVVLLILGVQLGGLRWTGIKRKEVWLAVLLRVGIVPLLSQFCILVLRIHGMLGPILLVQSSMPAAINNIVFAKKYGADTDAVTLTVAVTTLLSFVTLPIYILFA